MTEIMEAQANELLRHREWTTALDLFDRLLSHAVTTKCASKERIVCYLLARSECCLELGRHEAVVLDCRKIIKLLTGVDSVTNNGARARRRLVHALFTLQRFSEAEAAAAEWIASSRGLVNYNQEAVKMLEHVRIVLQMIDRGRRTSEDKVAGVGPAPDYCGEPWFYEEMRRSRNHPVKLIEPTEIELRNNRNDEYAAVVHVNHRVATSTPAAVPLHNSAVIDYRHQAEVPGMRVAEVEPVKMLCCSYCGISFSQRSELRAHCQSESHQTVIMSDEGRDWTWRPPPRGLTADSYTICENWAETGCCRFGAQCVEAHGTEELTEWQERFEYRRMKLQRACEKELYGKSYTEQLLDKLLQSAQPTDVMKDKIDGVEDSCSVPLVTSVSSKNSKNSWTFTMNTSQRLRAVALLQDNYRNHFFLTHVATSQDCKTILDYSLNNEQEFTNGLDVTGGSSDTDEECNLSHTVTVEFSTDIYGTFRQSVVFDFGTEPVLVKHLCVDVIPVTDADKIKEIRKELILSSTERWDKDNSTIVPFSSPVVGPNANETDRERELMAAYPTPQPDTFTVTQATVTEKRLTRNNYRARMHELLSIEEMARYDLVARYNLQARLLITKNYLLSPVCVGASTAKYAHNGELFALMNLTKDLSEDTSAGRLILSSCLTVLLSMVKKDPDGESDKNELRDSEYNEKQNSKRVVYEALIEDKGKNAIYLRLSASTVQALNLKPETKVVIDVQFQLNRIPYCEWHQAIDKIADFRFIFPDTYLEPTIPWSPQRQWNDSFDPKLNLKQKEAVIAITTPTEVQLPPILIIGPFGTGKTYTLAQAIKQVLKQPGTRILVCTHSNSAADLYIKDYLHPYVEAGHEEARPLRIFYHKRWVASVSPVVQKYAMVDINEQGARSFKIPKVEDILKYRVIVVTLSISMYLSTIGLPKGYFTHILLDEAAQAMECEAIMPLALANDNTRIVLAGDHMQLSPELFSQFAKERNLHMSLLERLYDHYLSNFPCKILLCENYRAHEAIIQFTSELFYEQKLISSGKQPKHEQFYPLTFFTTRGEDVQDLNSTAFYNNAEVYEVVERVSELKKRWPSAWGKLTDQSIGIMTPYADQVFRIRSELRKRRLGGISVERVLNVQGKQFRAVFLSTVRTRRTCDPSSSVEMEYGFLSNSKLLNTAITRAQSLVAVVGDPIALCSVGRCRKVWERFIDICHKNGSLYGIAWSSLRSQLDGVELKKTYTLNPLAPEFVPRQYQVNQYMQKPVVGTFTGGVAAAAAAAAAAMRFPPHFVPQVPAIYQAVPAVYYPAYPAGAAVQCAPPPPQAPPPQLYPAPPGAAWGLYQTVLPPPPQIHQQQLKRSTELSPPVRHDDIRAAVAAQPPPGLAQLPQVRIPAQIPLSNTNIQVINNYTSPQPQVLRTPQFITAAEIPRQIHIPRRIQDKLDIQFLQNVHFPERQFLLSQNPGPVLPANMTLEELLASQQKQFEWYNHLLDTLGPEAAAKFREFIAQVQKKIPHQVTDIVRNMDEMYIERLPPSMCNGHIPNGHHQPPMQVVPPPHMPPSSVSNYLVSLAVERAAALEDGLAMGEPPPLEEEMPRSSVPLYQRGHHQQVQQQQVVTVSRPSSTHQQQQVGGPDHLKQVQHQQQQQQQQMVSRGICPNSDVGRQMTYASVLRSRKEEQQKAEQMASISPLAILKELGNKQSGLYHYFS